jgi:hypothetical protein
MDIEQAAARSRAPSVAAAHVFIATSPIHLQAQAQDRRGECLEQAARPSSSPEVLVDEVEFSPRTRCAATSPSSAGSSRPVIEAGASDVNIPDTVGYAHPGTRSARRSDALPDGEGHRERRAQRALPRRPRARGGELAGGDRGGRAPGRVHDQRHRRARGQRGARGDRDGAGRAPRRLPLQTGINTARSTAPASCSRISRASTRSRTRRSSGRTPSRTRRGSTRTA